MNKIQQFYLKTFKKKDVIKVRLYFTDHRARTFYLIPKTNNITINERSFIINKDYLFYENGIPTYTFNANTTEAINVLDFKGNEIHTAETFNLALSAKVMKDFLNATSSPFNMVTALLFFVLFGVVILGVFSYNNNEALLAEIAQLRETLNNLTGGGA